RKNNSKKYFLYGLILIVVLTVTITFVGSKSNYRMTASIFLTEGKVVSSPYDVNIMAMYINDGDGNYQELPKETTLPTGYIINKGETYCCKGSNCKKENKDTNAIIETIGGVHTFRGISKGDKCFIYLDKDTSTAKTMSELLQDHYTGRKTREQGTFNKTIENTTMGVIYEGEDDDGITYYFAGNPLDNWVEFGGYYWRIIRINGDGSIRITYQGRTEDENGNKLEPQAMGEETYVGNSPFHNLDNDNSYMGYFYELGQVHGLKEPSLMYSYLNNWFKNSNIKQGTSYFEKIDINAGFCNDRTPSTSNKVINNKGGTGTTVTYYGADIRIRHAWDDSISTAPIFNCITSSDLFTFENSSKGNKVLENPVGLITADETIFAGLNYNVAVNNNYLLTGYTYTTLSPSWFDNSGPGMNRVWSKGSVDGGHGYFKASRAVRPVINLKSFVTFTGSGTQFNPFKVV
ncbi:MAG: hypothetical protein NC483_07500, partial [Ruminococcus sp.]|nr:hypothetical protein [Ruminococcus sp.]